MSENKFEHDFNWMRAYIACSTDCEFVRLENAAKEAVNTYTEAWKTKYPESTIEYSCNQKEENNCFVVSVTDKQLPSSGSNVVFTRKNNHIEIVLNRDKDKTTELTLTLNNQGECRYKINGDGEYLRWQVIKSLLLNVVFTRPV